MAFCRANGAGLLKVGEIYDHRAILIILVVPSKLASRSGHSTKQPAKSCAQISVEPKRRKIYSQPEEFQKSI
jgi:hypothetical protein